MCALPNSYLLDLDPDVNYYDQIISENHTFASFDSIDEFLDNNPISLNDNNFLSIFHQNIRSMNQNLDKFLLLFPHNNMPDVFVFSESWYSHGEVINIPGYVGHHTARHGRGGGVSIFVKSQISSEIISRFSYANNTIEICTIKISNGNNILYLFGIYRPFSDNIDNFSVALESILNDNLFNNSSCILAGDFNANLLSDAGEVERFIDLMQSNYYLQVISGITRPGLNHSTSSLLDQIWVNVNQLSNHYAGVVKSGVSDHYAIFIQIPFIFSKQTYEKIKITFRDCSTENQQVFENNLRDFNWDNIQSDDVNIFTQNFTFALNDIFQKSFSLKTKYVTHKFFKNPWHTKEVKKLSEARKQYHALLVEGLVTNAEYAQYRNKVTSLIRKCKVAYYERCFARVAGDIRASWKMIKKVCFGTGNKKISEIVHNDSTFNNPSDIADIFNNFFVNIANNLANDLPSSTDCPYQYVVPNQHMPFLLDPVTPEECSIVINSLKLTKQDFNTISVELFKKFHKYFLRTLCNIINLSFSSGIFPDSFKNALVLPLFKKGDSTNVSNYRPIAILPFISKIFEHCIFTRLTNYAAVSNLFSPNQFGFTKGKSTQDAIILLTDKIYECFNDGEGTFCINVFIDFKKAFDTIDHEILLGKLSRYGIIGTALNLIKNYLSNRTQSVRIGDKISHLLPITKGIFQGSKLGPLLFLFFINDLPNVSNNVTSVLFADDTTISFKCSSLQQANFLCNTELQKFFSWSAANKLTINFAKDKTYYILHSFQNLDINEFDIQINGNILENVDDAPFLGVFIDKHLNYKSHIDHIATKISKSVGIIKYLKSLKMPYSVLKQLYYSLVYSHFHYNIISYYATYPTLTKRLTLLQKRVLRIMNGAHHRAHTDPLFSSNKILKLQDIYKLNIGMYIYDRQSSADYRRMHEHYTRHRNDLLPSTARLRICQYAVSVAGPNNFNSIPEVLRESDSRESFKKGYKQFLLSFYDDDSA